MTRRLTGFTALGLLIAFGGPEAIVGISKAVGPDPAIAVQVLLQVLYCGLALLILVLVKYGERLPLSSIGLKRPAAATIVGAVGLFVAAFLLLPVVTDPMVKAWAREGVDAGMAELAKMPGWFRAVVGATGGVVEETLYRGYAVERLVTITGRPWLGGMLAAAAFAAAHIPVWGLQFALVAVLPFGILATVFYLWRRDVIANMLAHSAGLILAMFTIVPAHP